MTDFNETGFKVIDGGAVREPESSRKRRKKQHEPLSDGRPRIRVSSVNPEQCVMDLSNVIAEAGTFYNRGGPVQIVREGVEGNAVVHALTAHTVLLVAHQLAKPYSLKSEDGELIEAPARLPKENAQLYLSDPRNWNLPQLAGITTAPILRADGSIKSAEGYDPDSGFFIEKLPDISGMVPDRPTRNDAEQSLLKLRRAFRTFAFADAETIKDGAVHVVDLARPPGEDESALLCTLLTGVCRPSIQLAPGAIFGSAMLSGAGAGKGKLARCVSAIAFGRSPAAIPPGHNGDELEKVIGSALLEGCPAILLDNFNNRTLKSDTLASALTEAETKVRILGQSKLVKLNPAALVIVTGNALRVGEDLARRFIHVRFDAKMEDPEARPFDGDIVLEMMERRPELLAACLTIWRWGRQSKPPKGKPLGSFGAWGEWVRDPLLALGCKDPATRISEAKQNDAMRQRTFDILRAWWEAHGENPITANDLNISVKEVIDPTQKKSRQYYATYLKNLDGVRIGGFIVTSTKGGYWSPTKYSLKKTDGVASEELL